MKNLLKTMLLLLMSASIFSVHAQKSSSDELTAKIGNTPFKSENCLAFWNSNNGKLLIIGVNKNKNEKISITLTSEGRVYEKEFTKGDYYFAQNTYMLDNYSVNASYSNGDTDWKDNDDEKSVAGKVQITEISETQVKGTFYFDLTKKKYFDKEKDLFVHDKNDIIHVTEGSFSINLNKK